MEPNFAISPRRRRVADFERPEKYLRGEWRVMLSSDVGPYKNGNSRPVST
jgi:hypothetical protein